MAKISKPTAVRPRLLPAQVSVDDANPRASELAARLEKVEPGRCWQASQGPTSLTEPIDGWLPDEQTMKVRRGDGHLPFFPPTASDPRAVVIPAEALSPKQVALLQQWARQVLPEKADLPASELALALVTSPIALTGDGERTLDTLIAMKWVHPLFKSTMAKLVKEFGPKPLAGFRLAYNGHATEDKLAMIPMLRFLGCETIYFHSSTASGTRRMFQVMSAQIAATGKGSAVRTLYGSRPETSAQDNRYGASWNERLFGFGLFGLAELAAAEGEKLLVSKGSSVVTHYLDDPQLKPLVERGALRFLVHNQDDRHSLEGKTDRAYCFDVAGSRPKQLEAKVIGQQFAALGAEYAKKRWGAELNATPVVVVGMGLLGTAIVKALIKQGVPKSAICVVDDGDDPAKVASARRRARQLGVALHGWNTVPRAPGKALCFVATAATAIDAQTIQKVARKSIVLSVTSSGKSVDVGALQEGSLREEIVGTHSTTAPEAALESLRTRVFADRQYVFERGGQKTEALVVSDGFPLNLIRDSWRHRFSVTPLAIVAAACHLAKARRPGLVTMRDEVADHIVDGHRQAGLTRAPKHLDPDPHR